MELSRENKYPLPKNAERIVVPINKISELASARGRDDAAVRQLRDGLVLANPEWLGKAGSMDGQRGDGEHRPEGGGEPHSIGGKKGGGRDRKMVVSGI